MSEDHTQAPTPRMRQLARERGVVARSNEITSAAAFLATAALVLAFAKPLALSLGALVRTVLDEPWTVVDQADLVARVTGLVMPVLSPLLWILLGTGLAAVAAHQAQVRGVWVPGALVLDFERLMPGWRGGSLARGAWGLLRTLVLVVVAVLVVRSRWPEFSRLSAVEVPDGLKLAAKLTGTVVVTIGVVMLALGLVDFAFQYRRVEEQLRQTPEAQREDLRAVDGDPAIRARRREVARGWRLDGIHLLNGASLVVVGRNDLVVVLAGGPPPLKVTIRTAAGGPSGRRLRESALRRGLPLGESPGLARKLAQRRFLNAAVPETLIEELKQMWNA